MSSAKSTPKLSDSSVVKAVDHQTYVEVDGENVILDLEGGTYYGLDPIGAQIWEQIQEATPVDDVAASIAAEYDVGHKRCVRDILSLLRELEENDLITVEEQ